MIKETDSIVMVKTKFNPWVQIKFVLDEVLVFNSPTFKSLHHSLSCATIKIKNDARIFQRSRSKK
jgi:hypothetical protein